MNDEDRSRSGMPAAEAEIRDLRSALAAEREAHAATARALHRLQHGAEIEGDLVCDAMIERAESAEAQLAQTLAIEPGRTNLAALDCHICHHDPERRVFCSACRPEHCPGCWRRDIDDARSRLAVCEHERDEARAAEAAMRETLMDHGEHHATCAVKRRPEDAPVDLGVCDCGLVRALSADPGAPLLADLRRLRAIESVAHEIANCWGTDAPENVLRLRAALDAVPS